MSWLTELITGETLGAISLGLLLFQGPATLILLSRLLKGPGRRPTLEPKNPTPELLGAVSVVVPTLNEVERIEPTLVGLSRQSYEVREVIVVDSHSRDGTPERVKLAAKKDPRFRLISDDPLPPGWVGRPWALHTGFLHSSPKSQWVLGIDADTQPQPGLVASLVAAAEEEGYDLVSLSPQFILRYPGEWWLQPALLITLLYRFDSAGVSTVGTFKASLCPRFLTSPHGFDVFSFVITDRHKGVIEVFNLGATSMGRMRSLELIEHVQIPVAVVIDLKLN